MLSQERARESVRERDRLSESEREKESERRTRGRKRERESESDKERQRERLEGPASSHLDSSLVPVPKYISFTPRELLGPASIAERTEHSLLLIVPTS